MAPHLLFPQFMSDKTERELALFTDIVLMGKCEQLWIFGEECSSGMQAEIDKAKKRHIYSCRKRRLHSDGNFMLE